MSDDVIAITGGADEAAAAAIVAVVAQLLDEARTAAANPTQAPRQTAWVTAWRPRDLHSPLPSHVYDSHPWVDEIVPSSE